MIRMNEAIPAVFIRELGVNQEPRPYWVRTSQRFEKTHAQIWWKSLARDGANMNVAVQSTAAFQVRLYNNEDIRLIWLTHPNPPILLAYTAATFCEALLPHASDIVGAEWARNRIGSRSRNYRRAQNFTPQGVARIEADRRSAQELVAKRDQAARTAKRIELAVRLADEIHSVR